MRFGVSQKYLDVFTHPRTGREYVYYRRAGKRIRVLAKIGSPAFFAEIEEIEKGFRAPESFKPGTLGHLIDAYRKNDQFSGLAASTRTSYERAFAALAEFSPAKLDGMSRSAILDMRDHVLAPRHKRWMANYCVTVLAILFGYARDRGLVSQSPLESRVRKIRKAKGAARANRPWSDEERAVVMAESPPHMRLALALAMCCGLRKKDIFEVTLAALKDGEIAVRTSKRDTPVQLPIHPVLAAALADRPACDTLQIVVTLRGQPFTADGFDSVWHRFKKELEAAGKVAPGLTMHGLRHTLGTMLHEAGADDGAIADVLGQSTDAMARHYSREAKLPKRTRGIVLGLDLVKKGK